MTSHMELVQHSVETSLSAVLVVRHHPQWQTSELLADSVITFCCIGVDQFVRLFVNEFYQAPLHCPAVRQGPIPQYRWSGFSP